jgi:hypothetical protein
VRIKGLLIVATFLLAACIEQPPEESEPLAPVTTEEQEVDEGYWLPPLALQPPISDAIIPGDPAWPIESWTRLPAHSPAPTLEGLLGKVVVILCFQHW